jgi:RNA polymerase sigma-70 factor (ECF subfamily)
VPGQLTACFVSFLPAVGQAADPPTELEDRLSECLERARAAWPGVALSDELVLRHIAARIAPERPLVEGLAHLHVEGLYLAAGCVAGSTAALDRISALIDAQTELSLRRMRLSESDLDELRQQLRVGLLVAAGAEPAKIASYGGEGELAAWIRTCARRLAVRSQTQRQARWADDEDALLDLAASNTDAESRHVKERLGPVFRAACAEALKRLEQVDRAVLRHHFLDGLTIDQVGVLCGVSRATATRRIRQARLGLLQGIREALRRQPEAASVELESIVRALDSRFDEAASVLRAGLTPPEDRDE